MNRYKKIAVTFAMAAFMTAGAVAGITATGITPIYAEGEETQPSTIDVADCTVTLSTETYTYSGEENKPSVTVTYDDIPLVEGVDYQLSYIGNINAGDASVEIEGTGEYFGTTSKSFTINKAVPQIKYLEKSVQRVYGNSDFTNALSQAFTDGVITYDSSNTSIASVDKNSGRVTLHKVGVTTITATAAEGSNYTSATTSYTLTVGKAPAVLEFAITSMEKEYGEPGFSVAVSKSVTDVPVVYSSSNPKVATVDSESGRVILKGTGVTLIYAKAEDAKNYQDASTFYTLTVTKHPATLTYESSVINKTYGDGQFSCTPSICDTDATVKYTSSDTSVVAVEELTGKATIVGVGTAKITASALGGANYMDATATCTINVAKAASRIVFSSSKVNKTYLDSDFTKTPDTCVTDGVLTYTSSNPSVASVNSSTGLVYIRGAGTTTITVTTSNEKNYLSGSAKYELVVGRAPAVLEFNKTSLVKIFGAEPFTKTVDAVETDGEVTYSSSDKSVAIVDSKTGRVTIVGTGMVYIMAHSSQGVNYQEEDAYYSIVVNKASVSAIFDKETIYKTYGDAPFFAKANLSFSDGDVTYTSANTSVATVDPRTGEVTIVGAGKTVIRVVVTEGANYQKGEATYVLSVAKANPTLVFTVTKTYTDKKFSLSLKDAVTDGEITFTSEDPSIAKVDSKTGEVTIMHTGTVMIYASADDGKNYNGGNLAYKLVIKRAPNVIVATNFTKVYSSSVQKFDMPNLHIKSGVHPKFKSNTKYVAVNYDGIITIAKNFVGVAKITIIAEQTDNFEGLEKVITITVRPPKIAATKLNNLSGRKVKYTWMRTHYVDGYEINYSASSAFKNIVYKKTYSPKTVGSATYSGFVKNRTYYFRVRTYKIVNGVKVYSAWSTVTKIKVTK